MEYPIIVHYGVIFKIKYRMHIICGKGSAEDISVKQGRSLEEITNQS